MEWLGLSLGFLGLAAAIIALAVDEHIPEQLRIPSWGLTAVLVIAGLATGVEPLGRPIARAFQVRFGRYRFLLVYLFADIVLGERQDKLKTQARLALKEDYTSENWCDPDLRRELMSKLMDAVRAGNVKLYGRLVSEYGTRRFLTEVPRDHFLDHEIETIVAKQRLQNEYVYTYDPKYMDKEYIGAPLRNGCYCDLYVSRKVTTLGRTFLVGR